MIKSPWIILMVDRTRLGAPVFAVAKRKPDGKIRRTSRVEKAMRFATEGRAMLAAAILEGPCRTRHLYIAMKVGPGDFSRPKPVTLERIATIQSVLFTDAEGSCS